MKKLTLFLTIVLITSLSAISQDNKDSEPMKPALLVIDIQKAYIDMMDDEGKEQAIYYTNALIELFRKHNYPIICIHHLSAEWGVEPGKEGFEFIDDLKIKDTDKKVIKTYGDAFNKTELDKILKDLDCNTVFLCGLSATGCVIATHIGAGNYDYESFLVKKALLSKNTEDTKKIEDIFWAVNYHVVSVMLNNAFKKKR